MSSYVVCDPFGEVSDGDGEGKEKGVDGRGLFASVSASSVSSWMSDDDIMKAWARMLGVGVTSAMAAESTPAPPHWGLTDCGSRPRTAVEPPGGELGPVALRCSAEKLAG